jgi:uncharacterized protein YbjT (DUF2867 family)
MTERHVVTGAFSFTGRYIAEALLEKGMTVATLTRQADPTHPLAGRVESLPLQFQDADRLARDLTGADVLYNTYWVRFDHGTVSFDQAITNTGRLLAAAHRAGVKHLVHLSVSNPSEDSNLAYYRGKAIVERMVQESGLSYAIIRPTLIFGEGDLLINNIAWFLRRFPAFVVPGDGRYRVQPVSGRDVARLALEAAQDHKNLVQDAAGPEIYTFRDFVRLIARHIGSNAAVLHLPYGLALACCRAMGPFLGDVILNAQEIKGLMAELLVTKGAPLGKNRFSDWLQIHADQLGRSYVSELRRNYHLPATEIA